jgi:putative ABC transport system permease protein
VSADVRLGVGLTLLLAIALVVLTVAGVGQRRDVLIAAIRAGVQLAVIAAALRGVFAAPATSIAVVAVMFTVATGTASRRLRDLPGAPVAVVLSCGAGAAVTIGIIVGLPTLTRDVRTLVAVSGIVIGGTMTAATLTGRHLSDGMHRRRDEIEAWLSIGATPRQALRDIARCAIVEALVPVLDTTRTVGLVTLPGAFAGALLGGASAGNASRFQITVLIGLLAAETLTATTLAWLLGAPATIPAPRAPLTAGKSASTLPPTRANHLTQHYERSVCAWK